MRSSRFAGWAAIAGATIGIAITPFMASVWAYGPLVVWENTSLLTRLAGPTLESWGALSFGEASTPYEVYGKVFVLVYLLTLPVVRHVHVLHGDSPPRWEPKVWRILWIALIAAAIGDGVSYWGISFPEPVGDVLWRGGFLIESLALLVALVSMTLYGVITIRARLVPIWASVLLIAIIPIGVGTVVGVTDYLPNALVVPLSMVWAMFGAWVLINHRGEPGPGPEGSEPR